MRISPVFASSPSIFVGGGTSFTGSCANDADENRTTHPNANNWATIKRGLDTLRSFNKRNTATETRRHGGTEEKQATKDTKITTIFFPKTVSCFRVFRG